MNILEKSGIKLSWSLAYVGVLRGWISNDTVIDEIDPYELNNISSDKIAELYMNAEKPAIEFAEFIKTIVHIDDEVIRESSWTWGLAYLNDIYQSQDTVYRKLRKIESIWTMFKYPKEWKSFIYYMPVAPSEEVGESIIYRKFENFLKEEMIKLRQKGCME